MPQATHQWSLIPDFLYVDGNNVTYMNDTGSVGGWPLKLSNVPLAEAPVCGYGAVFGGGSAAALSAQIAGPVSFSSGTVSFSFWAMGATASNLFHFGTTWPLTCCFNNYGANAMSWFSSSYPGLFGTFAVPAISSSSWTHYVVSVRGMGASMATYGAYPYPTLPNSYVTMYVNGTGPLGLQSTNNWFLPGYGPYASAYIGRGAYGNFNGTITDFKMFNSTFLTQGQAIRLMQDGVGQFTRLASGMCPNGPQPPPPPSPPRPPPSPPPSSLQCAHAMNSGLPRWGSTSISITGLFLTASSCPSSCGAWCSQGCITCTVRAATALFILIFLRSRLPFSLAHF